MDTGLTQYMVVFSLPQPLDEAFISRIPQQRQAVNKLLHEGKILNYALSLETSKLWATFSAHSEAELMELISSLPLTRYMKVHISELTFYHSAQPFAPAFSVN